MPGKHRCSCFSEESSSFLYGLRREAPSTERVLLERLLNVLSRAAANKSRNPQRLWAETERPEWWTAVTSHPWKNPREHPKDNKKTLKAKIDILEQQLKERGMMTPELEEELEVQKSGKKVDLELKSDFEAVIAKASGLHFMLDKVQSKMGDSKPISERISKYIKETKSCMEKCLRVIDGFYERVEAREQHRKSLWEKHGVCKEEREQPAKRPHSQVSDDLETDSLTIDLSETTPEDVEALSRGLGCPSPFPPPPFSPSATLSSPQDISDHDVADLVMGPTSPTFIPQSQYVHAHSVSVSSYQRSMSLPFPVDEVPEPLLSVEGLRVRSVSPLTVPRPVSSAKKSKGRSYEGPSQHLSVKLTGRGDSLQPKSPVDTLMEVLGAEDVEIFELPQHTLSLAAGSEGRQGSEGESQRRRDRRQRQSPLDRPKSSALREKALTPPPFKVQIKESRKSYSLPSTHRHGGPQFIQTVAPSNKPLQQGWQALFTIPTTAESGFGAKVDVYQTSPLASEDLVEDGDEHGLEMDVGRSSQGEDLENVAEVLEESEARPTLNMYTEAADMSDMVHLAHMTSHLSCDDLQATVTEPVMDSTPQPLRPMAVAPGSFLALPASSAVRSGASKGEDSTSLSKAIGSLSGTF